MDFVAKLYGECSHAHTRDEVRQVPTCRFVPTHARTDDDYETVIVRDVYVFCTDCGELLECLAGD